MDSHVHGMIVQLPLPKQLDPEAAIIAIDPKKDADGLHPFNQGVVGRLKSWDEIKKSGVPLPCTPAGIIVLLLHEKIEIGGKNAVVIGRSTLVGKPVAQLLLSLNATVTIAHSQTKNLSDVCREADILIAALGKPHFITKEAVRPGAVVVDVGISRTESGLKGDVDFESVKDISSWITPVPGGVGPMTVCMLLSTTISSAERTIPKK
jgi:methylenetetrahydrofolate dehydrogenase (NADP+)/methenyltetrahydrofolate cyclohydrolase